VEIPTDDEIHDNIVAFWVPERPAQAGAAYRFQYRLHWQGEEPYLPTHIAQVFSTRIGRGGEPGQPRPDKITKFVVDFAGKALEALPQGELPKARVSAARGKLGRVFVEPVPGTPRYRIVFDLAVDGEEPVELRAFLSRGERALSESWLYQFDPRART
jgi:glucans biosynthesis protein